MSNLTDITVITATIPGRDLLLQRAVNSVKAQTLQPDRHAIMLDQHKAGHAAILDLLLAEVTTKYVAILDDDDELLPNHLELCYNKITETGADLVYPGFKYSSTHDQGHLECHFGVEWDNNHPHQTAITTLAKTDTIREVGGFSVDWDPDSFNVDSTGNRLGFDYLLILRLVEAGKIIKHVPERTWIYHIGHPSTLGMPSRA
jgi:glycosyltransferase involved in cell wall biosynthesis